jgi:hypothetical protein
MAKGTKTGGRQKGTPNATTKEIKELITAFIQKEFETIDKTYSQAPASERLKFLASIIQFSVPKLKEIESTNHLEGDGITPIIFEFHN